MEHVGIAADTDYLSELEAHFAAEVKSAQQAAHEVVGREFNLGSPKQLQEILFTERGLPKTKRIKSGYTTDADALQSLFVQTGDPVLEHLLRHRDVAKLKSTVDGLLKSVSDDGRIHTTFNQTVAATGRLSSTDPNLQNIPIRTEEGRRIRRAFIVGEGYEQLMTADYSQIEMRIMAHLSGDEALIEAFNSAFDFHAATASSVFHVPVEEVVPDQRRKIKAMNYGLAYGLSAFGLSNQLTISTDEARTLMEEYFTRFGGVRDYLQVVVRRAVQDGYTATILGRRRYLPDLSSDNRQRREMAERMALNAPIQGSAADIIKIAMLRVDGGAARVRAALADAAAGPRRAGLRRGAGRAGRPGGAGPPGDGRRLPAVGAAGGLGRRRPRLERRRPLSAARRRGLGAVPAGSGGPARRLVVTLGWVGLGPAGLRLAARAGVARVGSAGSRGLRLAWAGRVAVRPGRALWRPGACAGRASATRSVLGGRRVVWCRRALSWVDCGDRRRGSAGGLAGGLTAGERSARAGPRAGHWFAASLADRGGQRLALITERVTAVDV